MKSTFSVVLFASVVFLALKQFLSLKCSKNRPKLTLIEEETLKENRLGSCTKEYCAGAAVMNPTRDSSY